MKKILVLLLSLALLLPLASCGAKDPVYVKMVVKDYGEITLELYPDRAPQSVERFTSLADSGFYDGLTFHRVKNNFMIQGGDPKGDGTGGCGETLYGEFALNGFQNPISHKRGVISFARASYPYDSASSQFFICNADARSSLDGSYAAFGRVIEGMEVVDAITEATAPYGDDNGMIADESHRAVIESVRTFKR